MRTFTAKLEFASPYSQSRRHETPKLDKESHEDYDVRTWREHCTYDQQGMVCIPAMALKKAFDITAGKLSEKVPGKGNRTWAGYFRGGLIPAEQMFSLGIKKDDVDHIDLWCSSTGKPGGSQVRRRFPIIPKWEATIEFQVLDNSIPKGVIEHHVEESGLIVGIGRFRPENGGFNGRYKVKSFKWSNGG